MLVVSYSVTCHDVSSLLDSRESGREGHGATWDACNVALKSGRPRSVTSLASQSKQEALTNLCPHC